MDNLDTNEKIYFLGIGGTGMGAVAGLLKEAGYQVCGSDKQIYPPMSTMLEELQIPVMQPYDAANIEKQKPTRAVIGNAISKGHPELEAILKQGIPFTSFPGLIEEFILSEKVPIVITGTHGKTTTSSLMAHLLDHCGLNPGFFIGGIPRNFNKGFRYTTSPYFVLEGDEYDTAYFDKEPKFFHYKPQYLIINNIEYDHADIFENIEVIYSKFTRLVDLVPNPENIFMNSGDDGCQHLLNTSLAGMPIGTFGLDGNQEGFCLDGIEIRAQTTVISGKFNQHAGTFELPLRGEYNVLNALACLQVIAKICRDHDLDSRQQTQNLEKAFPQFHGVKRRQDVLFNHQNLTIVEDFAHHPSAINLLIEDFRRRLPKHKIVVIYGPANATSRRNVFEKQYCEVLSKADEAIIGPCPEDTRIPEQQRFNGERLAAAIGDKAHYFNDYDQLQAFVQSNLQRYYDQNSVILFTSSGSFSGIHYQLAEYAKQCF